MFAKCWCPQPEGGEVKEAESGESVAETHQVSRGGPSIWEGSEESQEFQRAFRGSGYGCGYSQNKAHVAIQNLIPKNVCIYDSSFKLTRTIHYVSMSFDPQE